MVGAERLGKGYDQKIITFTTHLAPDGSGRTYQKFYVPSEPSWDITVLPTVVSARSKPRTINMRGTPEITLFTGTKLQVVTLNTEHNLAAVAEFVPNGTGLKDYHEESALYLLQRRVFDKANLEDPDSFAILTYGQRLDWMLSHYGISQGRLAEAAHVSPSLVSRVLGGKITYSPLVATNWKKLINAFEQIVNRNPARYKDNEEAIVI